MLSEAVYMYVCMDGCVYECLVLFSLLYGDVRLVNRSIYLFNYLFICLISPLKGDDQGKGVKVQGGFTLLFPSAPVFFVEEHTEEGLPRLLAPSIFVAFYNLQGMQ